MRAILSEVINYDCTEQKVSGQKVCFYDKSCLTFYDKLDPQNLSKLNVLGIIKYLKDPSSTTNSDLINRSKDDKVLIMIHFSNDFKSEGGSFDFRILGALIDNKNYPLVKGSEFYNYCSQITSATEGKEVEWVLDPLSLKMT